MTDEETIVRRRSRRVDTQPSSDQYQKLLAALGSNRSEGEAAFLELVKLIQEIAHRDVNSHEDDFHADPG